MIQILIAISDIPLPRDEQCSLSSMEDEERRELIEEAMKYHEKALKESKVHSSDSGWSEIVFKVLFPLTSAVAASVARALCEHFLGG